MVTCHSYTAVVRSLAAAILVLTVWTLPSIAQGRWPAEYDSPLYFYSTDMTPIEVKLGKAVLHIPRAAIISAERYSPAQMSRLPDAIETYEIHLVVIYPGGEPLSTYAHELALKKGISEAAAVKSLRLKQYLVGLHYANPSTLWESNMHKALSRLPTTDHYDGLRHTGSDDYIGEQDVDAFVQAHCFPEARAETFCTTSMRIGDSLYAVASFPDFRFHGGRSYENERARKLQEIVCHYLASPCD